MLSCFVDPKKGTEQSFINWHNLTQQYRMHPKIMELSNRLVFDTLEEICFKRLSKYVLDTFYLLRFPTLGVEFLHEKNINRM